jgi:membrane-bound ClpP family serine protease
MLDIAIVAAIATLLLIVLVAFLSLRKRFANRDVNLIGASARVETALTPDGTVIVCGEIWPAQSTNGEFISAQRLVRVIGVKDLSLLVEAGSK